MKKLLAAAVVLLISGCTADEPPAPAPSPAPPAPISSAAPLLLAQQPLWSGKLRDLGLPRLGRVTLVGGDRMLVAHDGKESECALADVRTGKVLWSVRNDIARARGTSKIIGDLDGDWTLVAPFYRKSGDESTQGIIGYSGADGSVRWQIPVVKHREDDAQKYEVRLGAVDDDTVWATVDGGAGTEFSETRTEAWDIASRRKLYVADGLQAVAVTGDIVLAKRPGLPFAVSRAPTGTVSAHDRRTGKKRWDLAGRYATSDVAYAGNGLVVAPLWNTSYAIPGAGGTAILELATGKELAREPLSMNSCQADGDGTICYVMGPQFSYVQVGRDGSRTELTATRECGRYLPWRELFICSETKEDGTSRAVDRTGAVAGPAVPGEIQAIDERFAVVATGPITKTRTYAVFEITS